MTDDPQAGSQSSHEFASAPLHVTQEMIDVYAAISKDANPLHTDPAFAKTTPMGGTIAHGTLSVGLMLDTLEKAIGARIPSRIELRFTAPVRPEDAVTAIGHWRFDQGGEAVVQNQTGQVVIKAQLFP